MEVYFHIHYIVFFNNLTIVLLTPSVNLTAAEIDFYNDAIVLREGNLHDSSLKNKNSGTKRRSFISPPLSSDGMYFVLVSPVIYRASCDIFDP